jgi:N-acetylmuramoyl-L-alanine amidase
MPLHNVEQGDCFLSIADKYGFFWETLWNHPRNAELKNARKDPAIIYPGDVVFVPDKQEKVVSKSTGQMHKFKMKNAPAKLYMRFLDDSDKPRANLKYVLDIDGKEFKGTTDGNGAINVSIPPGAKSGTLVFENEDEEYDLFLGYLDPIEKLTGVQARLKGLGYYDGDTSGEMNSETEQAIKDFQEANQMEITGLLDDSLRNKLKDIYGS